MELLNEDNLKEAGITSEELRREFECGDNVYSMLFEYLELIMASGEVL